MAGSDIQLHGPDERDFDTILTPDALEFVAALQREFGARRRELLAARAERRQRLAAGEETLGFLAETASIREDDWRVAPAPEALAQRWVEITGPTDR
jgi:malate synthase